MQQVASTAIDNYINQPTVPGRRRAVPVDELFAMFSDLPPIDLDLFMADQDENIDGSAHFDAYLRAERSDEGV